MLHTDSCDLCIVRLRQTTAPRSVFNQAFITVDAGDFGRPRYLPPPPPHTVTRCNQLSKPYRMQNMDGLIGCSFVGGYFLVGCVHRDGWRALKPAAVWPLRAGWVESQDICKPFKNSASSAPGYWLVWTCRSLGMLSGTVPVCRLMAHLLGEVFFILNP